MSLYSVGKVFVKAYFKFFYRLEVEGVEHFADIPDDQGILLCANHVSLLDPPAVGCVSPRELSFMAKSELFKIPLFNRLITTLNAFPIKRGHSDRASLKTAVHILTQGKTLIMFPEGTRSKEGTIGEGKPGAGFLALRTNAVIIPVAIIGRYKLFRKTKIAFGAPIDLTEMRENRSKAGDVSKLIMDHIKGLYNKYNH
ncbi:MAG: lysophospholipid acyltransferase family protein [Tuberibacillus sp.]